MQKIWLPITGFICALLVTSFGCGSPLGFNGPAQTMQAANGQLVNVATRALSQNPSGERGQHPYSVIELGTFGGTNCCGVIEVNNKNWVDGTSNLPGDKSFHPFLWVRGRMIDLGTLGGPNASVGGLNDRGEVTVGGADTGMSDPLGEDACGFGTYQTCLSFVWHDGNRVLIPTLGGNNNDVNTVNNRGRVLAISETATRDPSCIAPQALGVEAFIWNPISGHIDRLPPLAGDSASEGYGFNEQEDVAGWSGACGKGVDDFTNAHQAVLWRNGKPVGLGSLGGSVAIPFAMNNRDQIVGASLLPGNAVYHAFLWTSDDGMRDLGTLPGDSFSIANNINSSGQVAAQSCDVSSNCRATIWDKGVMTDLNALIPSGSPLFLLFANSINDSGAVVGAAYDQQTATTVPFLAIPREGEYLLAAQVAARSRKIVLPDRVRKMLQHQRTSLSRVVDRAGVPSARYLDSSGHF